MYIRTVARVAAPPSLQSPGEGMMMADVWLSAFFSRETTLFFSYFFPLTICIFHLTQLRANVSLLSLLSPSPICPLRSSSLFSSPTSSTAHHPQKTKKPKQQSPTEKFCSNEITTSRYTLHNFVFKNLWQQFQRAVGGCTR
jgi:hypothetical protein